MSSEGATKASELTAMSRPGVREQPSWWPVFSGVHIFAAKLRLAAWMAERTSASDGIGVSRPGLPQCPLTTSKILGEPILLTNSPIFT